MIGIVDMLVFLLVPIRATAVPVVAVIVIFLTLLNHLERLIISLAEAALYKGEQGGALSSARPPTTT